MSCDEYPIATSKNGLSAGGTRRSFDGCSLPNIPSGTGAKGASICMIPAVENSSQGGSNTQFFRAERMLSEDPFRVLTSNGPWVRVSQSLAPASPASAPVRQLNWQPQRSPAIHRHDTLPR
ncbi:NucA/NucB deoxyribonuclease domain-containing protein [Streptomyces griseoluteus]